MKKFSVFVFLTLFLVSSFVSAQITPGTSSSASIWTSISNGAGTFYDSILEPFAKFFLGRNTETGEILFAKLLMFGLLLTVIWLSLDKFPLITGKRGIIFIVSAIVAILSVRYVTAEWLNVIILPYGAVGIAFSAILPLIPFFFFVEVGLSANKVLRKFSWIILAVVYLGLYLYRGLELIPTANGFNPGNIYLFATVACLILLIADNTVQNAFLKAYHSNRMSRHVASKKFDLDVKYNKVIEDFLTLDSPTPLQKDGANIHIDALNAQASSLGLPANLYVK